MTVRYWALTCVATLTACTTISEEQVETRTINSGFYAGTEYQVRTRTMQGSRGAYTQTSVALNGLTKVCILDSPGDCDRAARNLADGAITIGGR